MPQSLPPRATALLLALVLALLVLRLGGVPLLGPDEPRYARVAVEMQRSGEWVTPTLQGEPWLEKPPLYYWLAADNWLERLVTIKAGFIIFVWIGYSLRDFRTVWHILKHGVFPHDRLQPGDHWRQM